MGYSRNNPNKGQWLAPFLLAPNQDVLPAGRFLVPLCTNRQGVLDILGALYYAKSQGADYYNLAHMWDFLEALAHIAEPDEAECSGIKSNCTTYPPSAGFITFEPADPYAEIQVIPDGYTGVPFRILQANDLDVLLFYLQVGDVMATAPPIAAGINFPRFRVTVTGTKEVELHLLTHPVGGFALISVDGSLIPTVADLERDLSAIPPESAVEVVHNVQTFGEGEHTIDVTFIPTLDGDLIPIGFGGGVRSVTVCRDPEECDVYRIRQNEVEPCLIEEQIDDGLWAPVVNLSLCAPNIVNVGGGLYIFNETTGVGTPISVGDETTPIVVKPPRPRPETNEGDARCNAAANAVQVILGMHQQIFTSYFPGILISVIGSAVAAFLAYTLGVPVFLTTLSFNLSLLVGFLTGANVLDFTGEIQDELKCILFCASNIEQGVVTFNYGEVSSKIDQKPVGVIWSAIDVYISIIGESGLNLAGATTSVSGANCNCAECADCVNPETFSNETCFILQRFSDGNYGFSFWDVEFGNPAPSIKAAEGSGSGNYGYGVRVSVPIPVQTVSSVTLDWYWNGSANPNNVLAQRVILQDAAGAVISQWTEPANAGQSQNVWHTRTVGISGTNVAYIVYEAGVNGGGSGAVWVDNLGWA